MQEQFSFAWVPRLDGQEVLGFPGFGQRGFGGFGKRLNLWANIHNIVNSNKRDVEMQAIGVILTLITIATVLGPMATVVIQCNNNLTELVLPHQISEALNSTLGTGQFETPTFVSSDYDNTTRTATLTVNFTNTFNYDLTLRSISGTVECTDHNYTLGILTLNNIVQIPAGQSSLIPVLCALTGDAQTHFQAEHVGATSIDVNVINLTVNVNDITVQLSEKVELPNIPIVWWM